MVGTVNWPKTYVMGQSITGRLEAPITPVATTILTSTSGTFGADGEGSTVAWAPTVTGTYGAKTAFTATRDLSAYQYIGMQMSQNAFPYSGNGNNPAALIDTLANGGMSLVWYDSGGNWSEFYFYGDEFDSGNIQIGGWQQYAARGASGCLQLAIDKSKTPDASSGTLDWSLIDGVELGMRTTSTNGTANIQYGSIMIFDPIAVTGGTGGSPATFEDFVTYSETANSGYNYYDTFKNTTGNFNGGIGELYEPVYTYQIGDGSTVTVFRDTGSQVAPYPDGYTSTATLGKLYLNGVDRGFEVNTSATCDIVFNGTVIPGPNVAGGQHYTEVLGNTSGTVTWTNCQFYRQTSVKLTHSTATGGVFDDCEVVEVTADTTLTTGIFRNGAGTSTGLRYTGVAADKSAITADFTANSGIDLSVGSGGAGTYTFSGLTTSGGHTLNIWNESTSNSATVELAAGISNQPIDLWFGYDNEASGPFSEGEVLTFANGATATLVVLQDNGTTGAMYCELLTGSTPPDNNGITGGTSSATADVDEAGGANKSTLTISSPAVTFTFNSDTASTLIRYFEDASQTVVDSATGTTLAYEFPDADPMDAEFVKQSYVPVNRQDVIPSDGGTLDVIMDYDEAYNSAHGLTITTEYDYVRATKVLTINSDQEALDVRSSIADVIRTNSSYYNTPLLAVAIPGLTRVDLTDGMTITSMATWKGAGMEMFDSADALNPVEKWFSIKSVGTITGATTHYRQTSSGSSTAVTLTSNVVNEAFQYWDDPNHDGSTADGYDYSGYMVVKAFLAGSKQGRVDVVANSGAAALNSNLFTVPLANEPHGYSGSDPGISADITLVAGGTVGGVAFSYELVDGGTNTGADIADQLNYNSANNPNTVIPGGTLLTYFELSDMVIHNATAVETEQGYEEGASPALVGFYCSRGGSDHPDFTRFQGDNGTYYTPAVTANVTVTNLSNDGADINLSIANQTAESASGWDTLTPSVSTVAIADKILRSTGLGTENTAGLYYVCTTAGTIGASEPTFPTIVGNTVADGTVTWTCYAILFYDADPASTGYSTTYTNGEEFDTGDTVRYRYADMNGVTSFKIDSGTVITSSSGFTIAASPAANTVYATNALDGRSVAITNIYTADYSNNDFELDANLDFTNPKSFAFYCGELTTSQGMYSIWGAVSAIDAANYYNDVTIATITFDESGGFVKQEDSDTSRWYRSDGTRPFRDPSTGGAGLSMNWKNPVYTISTGSVLSASEKAELTQAAEAQAVNTKVGTPASTVSDDIAALPTAVENRQEMDSNSTQLAAIVLDTGTTLPAQIVQLDTDVAADIAAVKSDTGSIKTKTDSLTFTVANKVDSNVKSVNDSAGITGTGTEVDPWGP